MIASNNIFKTLSSTSGCSTNNADEDKNPTDVNLIMKESDRKPVHSHSTFKSKWMCITRTSTIEENIGSDWRSIRTRRNIYRAPVNGSQVHTA